ncbi:MAG: carbon storage regulator [Sulfurimonas sp.]|nr:MAG: carbon storage regulator [Sulfurimonas sp.]
MLVLTRKADDAIVIGDSITITVVSVEGGVVKLGIDAPKEVNIIRSELLKEVENANKAASKQHDDSFIEAYYTKYKS